MYVCVYHVLAYSLPKFMSELPSGVLYVEMIIYNGNMPVLRMSDDVCGTPDIERSM